MQGADEGTADRADSAHDDDDEGEDQDVLAHAEPHGVDRAGHGAGQGGQGHAEGEDEREEAADIDAQGREHLAIAGAGADAHAGPGAGDQPPQAQRSDQPRGEDGEPEGGIGHAQDDDLAREDGRRVEEDRLRAEQDADQLVEQEQKAEGAQHLVEMVAARRAGGPRGAPPRAPSRAVSGMAPASAGGKLPVSRVSQAVR